MSQDSQNSLEEGELLVLDATQGSDTDLNESDCQIVEQNISTYTLEDTDIEDKKEQEDTDNEGKKSVEDTVIVSVDFTSALHYIALKIPLVDFLKKSFREHLKDEHVEVIESDGNSSIQVVKKDKKIIPKDETDDDACFVIDCNPNEKNKDITIPSYKKTMKRVLDLNAKEAKDPGLQKTKSKNVCWNCDGDHSVRDCKEPRNHNKINKAKQDFNRRPERYHCELEQKYGHITPGVCSESLRQALGLKKRDIPLHVYRMRLYGYPPGWLEEAKVKHSGMNMFDSKGVKVLESDEDDGEIEVEKDKYDIRKIISFPGFNVPPEAGMYDDSKHFNVPPMMEFQSREALVAQLEGNLVQGYRRKKMKPNLIVEEPQDKVIMCDDMEVVDEIEDEEMSKTVNSSNDDSNSKTSGLHEAVIEDDNANGPLSGKGTPRTSSPSLEELTKQKQSLLALLDNSGMEDSLIEDVLMLEKLAEENENDEDEKMEDQTKSPIMIRPPLPSGSNMSDDIPPPPPIEEENLMSTVLGTPILKPFSPFSKVPKGENFSIGVSDVINFENLPDSTGKYEKMKDILFKVRTIAKNLNDE